MKQRIVIILILILSPLPLLAALIPLDLGIGDAAIVTCNDGQLTAVSSTVTMTELACDAIPTPSPVPSPPPIGPELLTNWQLYNAEDGNGLYCDPALLQSAPYWTAEFFGFRGPWNEDPDGDGCVARTMGEEYPDNSSQTNHIPAGGTGTLWQVAQAPMTYTAVILSSTYAQHESGEIHWSLWDCPNVAASVNDCTLIYRTNSNMRITPLNTKSCSAFDMSLTVALDGSVNWQAPKNVETCNIVEPLPQVDITAVFSPAEFIGVYLETTPKENPTIPDDKSGIKLANIKLSVVE